MSRFSACINQYYHDHAGTYESLIVSLLVASLLELAELQVPMQMMGVSKPEICATDPPLELGSCHGSPEGAVDPQNTPGRMKNTEY